MLKNIISFLRCPECKNRLLYEENKYFICEKCKKKYFIKNRVPVFAEENFDLKTKQHFGFSWILFPDIYKREEKDFFNWIYPVDKNFFKDKIILDAGCGNGLHTDMVAKYGAKRVFGMDLSNAVISAYKNTRDKSNITIIQGNIYSPPFEEETFDYIYSIGVLQHLPDKEKAVEILVGLLKERGSLSLWVYGYEGTFFVRVFIEPIRKILIKLNPKIVFYLSIIPAWLFYFLSKTVKLLGSVSKKIIKIIPLGEYFFYMADFPFKYQHNTVFDQLIAPRSYFFKKEELEKMFLKYSFKEIIITSRNNMSWRVFAKEKGEKNIET